MFFASIKFANPTVFLYSPSERAFKPRILTSLAETENTNYRETITGWPTSCLTGLELTKQEASCVVENFLCKVSE